MAWFFVFFCFIFFVSLIGFIMSKILISKTTLDSVTKKNQTNSDETDKDQMQPLAAKETPITSQRPSKANKYEQKEKKSYADFLIDRPFNVNQSKSENETTFHLMNCLRHRLRIDAHHLETDNEGNTTNTSFDSNLETALRALSLSSPPSHNSSLLVGDNEGINSKVKSLYDTLLQLIDEFDATGVAEIFRLLLERRSAIPLFVPESGKHYLSLMRQITLPGIDTMSGLGENKSLMRVAVISCRQRNQSQTCDILKNVFHIDSIHSHDFTTSNFSSETMLAEIGRGCIVTEESGSQIHQNVLVVHVIGDFRPLWSFLRRFADCYLIEDSINKTESFFSSFLTEDKTREMESEDNNLEERKKLIGCIWKPSNGKANVKVKDINGFRYLHIEDQLSCKTLSILKSGVVKWMKEISTQPNFLKNRWMLCEIPILEAEGYSSLECVSPTEIESSIAESVTNLGDVKKNEFLLQKNFLQEAKYEEEKMENRLNDAKVRELDGKIKTCRENRRVDTQQVENNALLKTFLNLISNNDRCSRVLSIKVLEKELAKRGEKELGPLSETITSLWASYNEKLSSNAVDETDLDSDKEKLRSAKSNLIESALNIEHLWRELSQLYTTIEPEKRSPVIEGIPRLAAQHLLDGFCLELLDGDSNMIHMNWITKVFNELGTMIKNNRIFVLSVMGIQSSGKSTLLNTMFGIRMRTSVGQCTRGVNMQLVPVEGRPEYDYILLLDTEGTRSPGYHGLPGSEKRDNQMATLSILLSDATIVIMPGEDDAAVKEILPIVLMAYQGSKLAEENGGRLSSRMFFVYNRIDTSQENKMASIIQALGTSLREAFSQVQKSTDLKSEDPFSNIKLNACVASGSGVCILGNVKKQSKPPGDVPDEAYGEGLNQFRENIDRQVTNAKGGDICWKSRSIGDFSRYIGKVWKCICSANFTFNFSTVLEHMSFDKLDFEYKSIERKLAEAYQESFAKLKQHMIKLIEEQNKSSCSTSMRGPDGQIEENIDENSSISFETFEVKFREELHLTKQELDKEVEDMVKKDGREKWSRQFEEIWKNNKKDQAFYWKCNLYNAFNRLFHYERHVEQYKKKMRKEINQLFKSSTDSNVSDWTEEEKKTKFEEMFKNIVAIAKKKFPPKDVSNEIEKVYQNSNPINSRKIELNWPDNENDGEKPDGSHSSLTEYFKTAFNSKVEQEQENRTKLCFESVLATVNRIASGKLCYDDSIISDVICEVDLAIKKCKLIDNSEVQFMHVCGMKHIVHLMQVIEKKWETENSVSAKLESSKEIMRKYFVMVSQGVKTTQLFAATMAATLENVITLAFKNEMMKKTLIEIRNERWLHDARLMQKHMDLYLIDLLEKNQVDEVLENIRNPKKFYEEVLHRLIAQKVPSKVDDEWQSFKNRLRQAMERAALAIEVDFGRAQAFADQLRTEFLEGYLKSEILGSAFRIDCRDEYEDCDNEELKKFREACSTKLKEVLEKPLAIENRENFAEEISPEVVQHMIALNDKAALPRCDACCYMCKSLCIEAANHDTNLTPHDTIHQPGGIAGLNLFNNDELDSTTCSQGYEQDDTFYLNKDYSVFYNYKDYSKIFPGWKDPRIDEEMPVREYILATYNKQIAEKYKLKPSTNIPASYSRNLSSIKEQLEREIAGTKSN